MNRPPRYLYVCPETGEAAPGDDTPIETIAPAKPLSDAEIIAAFQSPELAALHARYSAAAHAMQSGVAFDADTRGLEAKHLRVGINSALVEASALAMILMRKGICTPAEYLTALCEKMEQERESYAQKIKQQTGAVVGLS